MLSLSAFGFSGQSIGILSFAIPKIQNELSELGNLNLAQGQNEQVEAEKGLLNINIIMTILLTATNSLNPQEKPHFYNGIKQLLLSQKQSILMQLQGQQQSSSFLGAASLPIITNGIALIQQDITQIQQICNQSQTGNVMGTGTGTGMGTGNVMGSQNEQKDANDLRMSAQPYDNALVVLQILAEYLYPIAHPGKQVHTPLMQELTNIGNRPNFQRGVQLQQFGSQPFGNQTQFGSQPFGNQRQFGVDNEAPYGGKKKRRTRRRKQRGGCSGYSKNGVAANAAPFTGGRKSRRHRRKTHKRKSHRR
jgi:hypothetical protein